MGIFDAVDLTNQQRIEAGIPLPDHLSIRAIAELWSDVKEWQEKYVEAMLEAFKTGKLKGEKLKPPPENPNSEIWVMDMRAFLNHDILIHRDDFLSWLDAEGEARPTGCLLTHWWKDEQIKSITDFEKRLDVLKQWMDKHDIAEGSILPKQYTVERVYCELAKMDGDLFNSIEQTLRNLGNEAPASEG
ncbi:hypothetical protein [Methylomonas sp. MgM2]